MVLLILTNSGLLLLHVAVSCFLVSFNRKRNLELWPVTLTYDIDVDRVNVNHNSKYLGQRLLLSTIVVRTHTHTHTHTSDRLQHLDHKMIASNSGYVQMCDEGSQFVVE